MKDNMKELSDLQLSDFVAANNIGRILGSATAETKANAEAAIVEWRNRYPRGVESPKPWAAVMCAAAGVPCLSFQKDF